ncbi:MAG: GNAT family N-acetyltransferase [Alphaproteobacteria bacterium]|nr:GNAT family N-acetyltransferase [Alphaproteobacteria bacterium]
MTITIRRARPEDRATIRAFLDALQEHERGVDPSKLTAAEATPAYLAETEAEVAAKDGAFFIAEQDGRPVGFTGCWRDHDSDVSIKAEWQDFGYVSDIYLAPEARGQGIARRLYQACEDHCAALGLKRMRIRAINRNGIAMASHQKFGFAPLYTVFDKPIGR